MSYSLPAASSSHSFRPYQQPPPVLTSSAPQSRHSYHPAPAAYDYLDVPAQPLQPAPLSYRRRVDEPMHYSGSSKLSVTASELSHPSAAAASSSASSTASTSSSFSPLSLCSSVSSCSSSSSGSSSSAYSSPADTFDLEEMGEEPHGGQPHQLHHSYYQPQHSQQLHRPKQQQLQAHQPAGSKPSRPTQLHHQPGAQDSAAYYPPPVITSQAPQQHLYGHSHSPPPNMTVSIPAANGGWKDLPNGVVRRREAQLPPQAHPMMPAELPAYLPAPLQPVVASAAEVVTDGKSSGGGKKKKGRSLRRCMDREKHSKAEQKRRGEMKQLFDQLQDISQCVYKDRIHILTLAIQTIQRQQDAINDLQAQVKDGKGRIRPIKKEQPSGDSSVALVPSDCSSPASNGELASSKRAAVAAELDCEPVTVVKQEEDCLPMPSPKKQRTSPHPRDVVDLSTEATFAAPSPSPSLLLHEPHSSSTVSALASTSYVSSKALHNSFSSSSLSTFVCSSTDAQGSYPSYLMDEQPHTSSQYHAQHADDPVVSKSQLVNHVMQSANASYPTPPGMSPVFSFTAHPQHWWPSAAEPSK